MAYYLRIKFINRGQRIAIHGVGIIKVYKVVTCPNFAIGLFDSDNIVEPIKILDFSNESTSLNLPI